MTNNEIDLVKRITDGDQGAFKTLYVKYSDLLFAYILHHVGNDKDAASDIWQETWIVFVEKIKDFQYRSTVFTWLSAIAKNKISDYYRSIKKQEILQGSGKLNFDFDTEELDVGLIDAETQADVITILANLTDGYRYLLEAKYIGNKSTDEISRETGKTYKATESMLTRAREAFRKEFKHIKS